MLKKTKNISLYKHSHLNKHLWKHSLQDTILGLILLLSVSSAWWTLKWASFKICPERGLLCIFFLWGLALCSKMHPFFQTAFISHIAKGKVLQALLPSLSDNLQKAPFLVFHH